MSEQTRPILKWAGGKRELLPEILSRIPPTAKDYFEPFFGGGALFISLAEKYGKDKKYVVNDINDDLMTMYRDIKTNPVGIIEACKSIVEEYQKFGYYHIRSRFNGIDANKNPTNKYVGIERSGAIIVLNRTCFNGLYRTNKSGYFNVPKGNYKNPKIINESNILQMSQLLPTQDNIRTGQFDDLENINPGDFVYFDPPYVPISVTSSFTGYSEPFGLSEQIRLRDFFNVLDERGVFVLASNSSAPLVAELYSEFRIDLVACKRNVNSKPGKRGAIMESLILGKSLLKAL